MPVRALLSRLALALLALLLAAIAAVGGVALAGSGLVVVMLAAAVTACLAAGVVQEGGSPQPRQAVVDAAWRAAVATVAVLLVLSGCAVLAGGGLTALLAGVAVGARLVRWALRSARRTSTATGAVVLPLTGPASGAPVRTLTVEALGREWLRTSAALAGMRDAATQQALADRRQEALDELERRNPVGIGRWLVEGATVDSDPTRYVSGDPTAGYDAA